MRRLPTNQQTQMWLWTYEALREDLKSSGWLPPHSFALTNPDEEKPQKRTFYYRYYCPSVLSVGKERDLGKEKTLEKMREGFYWREKRFLSGEERQEYDSLSNLLWSAAGSGHTQVEYVRHSFVDIRFLVSKIRHLFNPDADENRQAYEDLFLPHSSVRYRNRSENWREAFQPGSFQHNTWNIQVQDNAHHVALLHMDEDGVDRVLQWEDDPYLVHIADSYVLFLLYQDQLPHSQQDLSGNWGRFYQELETWGPEHFPVHSQIYSCPEWFARILQRGMYLYEEDAPFYHY